MSAELVLTESKYRTRVPDSHRQSVDTRLVWLWHQRFGTVQTVWQKSPDLLDHTAATLILQAIMGKDLDSIKQLLKRLEGGALDDTQLAEREPGEVRI